MKRGEELGVEPEDFLDMIGLLTFVNVHVYSVALPPSKQFDIVPRDAVAIGSDSGAFA